MKILPLLTMTLSLIAQPPASASPAAAKRPNFIFFLTDDQAANAMSCAGNPVLNTPNMDHLAAEGVLFENAFVTTSICCSSRASILTGQHMRRHGIKDFQKPLSAAQWKQTFPALLRGAGYRTAFLGKFAIGAPELSQKLALPDDEFDLWYGFPQSIAFKQSVDGTARYLTTLMTGKAIDFLRESKPDQPFCLIVALKEPHGPKDFFDPEFKDPVAGKSIPLPSNFNRASFERLPGIVQKGMNAVPQWIDKTGAWEKERLSDYALIARADLAIGQICKALKDCGLDDNTVIIHSSDNGSFGGAHALEGKWLMYEESIRVPLIIRDPRLTASTRGSRPQMALNIDLAPTILSMAGLTVPAAMQGTDLREILREPATKGREDWYYEHLYTPGPGKRKPIPQSEGVRTERWKYIRYTEPSPPLEQLFDLAADPQEEKDLAGDATLAETLTRLRARCDELRKTLQ
jgi:arylsulfatase A-like enzyme